MQRKRGRSIKAPNPTTSQRRSRKRLDGPNEPIVEPPAIELPPDSTLAPSAYQDAKKPAKAPGIPQAKKQAEERSLIGDKLSDRYRVIEKIGEGGMGKIYLAEDERLGKKVVVKLLPANFIGKTDIVERFKQEAKIASQIEQENIVNITDLIVTNPPFYVMEHLKGTELGASIREEGCLRWDEHSKEILMQICRALGAAHGKGVAHRDMKPNNIFISERSDGKVFVKIIDFGIAKLLAESAEAEKSSGADDGEAETADGQQALKSPGLTRMGEVFGTPFYMAPEQGKGQAIDHRVDIYSVGVMMYEMFTGDLPFMVDDPDVKTKDIPLKILAMHCTEAPVPPRQKRPEASIPEDVEAAILKALQKDPANRFADMKEMEIALSKCPAPKHKPKARMLVEDLSGAGSASRSLEGLIRIRKADHERKMTKIRAGIAAGVLAAAIGLAATNTFHNSKPAPENVHSENVQTNDVQTQTEKNWVMLDQKAHPEAPDAVRAPEMQMNDKKEQAIKSAAPPHEKAAPKKIEKKPKPKTRKRNGK